MDAVTMQSRTGGTEVKTDARGWIAGERYRPMRSTTTEQPSSSQPRHCPYRGRSRRRNLARVTDTRCPGWRHLCHRPGPPNPPSRTRVPTTQYHQADTRWHYMCPSSCLLYAPPSCRPQETPTFPVRAVWHRPLSGRDMMLSLGFLPWCPRCSCLQHQTPLHSSSNCGNSRRTYG